MPVDLFPPIKIPVVVVATFFSGMPPEQVETDITGRFERFFTLAAGIDHMESRSLSGVSLIKVFFQPRVNPDAAVTTIANLAMADLRRLPPGTLPPVVLKFDASSLPVTDSAILAGGVYSLKNQQQRIAAGGVVKLLQRTQFLNMFFQKFSIRFLGPAKGLHQRRPLSELDLFPGPHPEIL
jgi:multidrug efflux pump subunit AcrB